MSPLVSFGHTLLFCGPPHASTRLSAFPYCCTFCSLLRQAFFLALPLPFKIQCHATLYPSLHFSSSLLIFFLFTGQIWRKEMALKRQVQRWDPDFCTLPSLPTPYQRASKSIHLWRGGRIGLFQAVPRLRLGVPIIIYNHILLLKLLAVEFGKLLVMDMLT